MPVNNVYSALLFASNARDVRLTMVAGKEVFQNGKAQLVDEDLLKKEMREIVEQLKNV